MNLERVGKDANDSDGMCVCVCIKALTAPGRDCLIDGERQEVVFAFSGWRRPGILEVVVVVNVLVHLPHSIPGLQLCLRVSE